MKYDKMTRRMFLQGAGKTTLAIPFLSSLAPLVTTLSPSEVYAATNSMKYVMVHSDLCLPYMTAMPGWFNYEAGSYYDWNKAIPWTQAATGDGVRYQNLQDITAKYGKLSFVFDENWNSHLSKINLISQAHRYTQAELHNNTNATCASAEQDNEGDFGVAHWNYSADQILSESLYGGAAPSNPILHVGYTKDGYRSFSDLDAWRSSHNVVNGKKVRYLALTIEQLYSKLVSTGSTVTTTAVNPKAKIVDLVLQDFKEVSQSRTISSEDKTTLSHVMDMWNDLLKSLSSTTNTGTLSCSYPAIVTTNATVLHQTTMKLVSIALGCGVSNIVNYGLNDLFETNLGTDVYHTIAHDSSVGINGNYMDHGARWRANRVLDFIKILSSTPAANGGTVFDNVVLNWNHEFANHNHDPYAYVQLFASGATTKFDLGQNIDAAKGPINRLFFTSLRGMGLTTAQIEREGNAGFGEYRVTLARESTNNVYYWPPGKKVIYPAINWNYSGVEKFLTAEARRSPYHFFKG